MRIPAIVTLMALLLCGPAQAQMPETETSLKDQTDVAVTAYNNGLALVRDTRKLQLPSGELQLKFMDVAEKIRPQTVGLRSLSAPGSVGIIEQNYEYDLMSPSKLMEKYVGKSVKLINYNREIGFEQVDAELLSTNDGPIYRVGNQIFLGHPGNVVLPEIPGNLIAKPTLIWQVQNESAAQTLELTYLTEGVSWMADYVVTLARDDATLAVAGWVTMNNQSGATYTNAKLKLVAGEVHVEAREEKIERFMMADAGAAPPLPAEEAFAEYHLYTMPRRTTIKQNQSKQLALLNGADIPCSKKYEYRGEEYFYSQRMPPRREEHVAVFIEFKNEAKHSLGIPLPAGVMRIYQEDSEGMLQFAGEDRIDHTPKDEKVELHMGSAFDVIGERVQMDYRQIASNVHQSAYEITLRNHKDREIKVDVVEPMPGSWEILLSSQPYVKKDARTVVFTVPVAKDGESKVTYRVQVTY